MTGTAEDNPWRELDALDRRHHARLESRFGMCVVCGRGATDAVAIGDETWATCKPCNTLWHVGRELLAPVTNIDVLGRVMRELARYHHLDGSRIEEKRMAPTKSKTIPQNPTKFDWHMLSMVKDPDTPKPTHIFRTLDQAQRAVVGGACVDVLLEHPHARKGDIPTLAYQVWNAVRGRRFDHSDDTIADLMRDPRIDDPIFAISSILRLLLEAGDLRATLESQRAAINETLAQLAALAEIAR